MKNSIQTKRSVSGRDVKYRIHGSNMWCLFIRRADVFALELGNSIVRARTILVAAAREHVFGFTMFQQKNRVCLV